MKLRYMIIGAGGVGGPVGAYLSKSGADTTLIARGKHLAVLQEHGLTLVSGEPLICLTVTRHIFT